MYEFVDEKMHQVAHVWKQQCKTMRNCQWVQSALCA